jgi:dienelactone hydrolase
MIFPKRFCCFFLLSALLSYNNSYAANLDISAVNKLFRLNSDDKIELIFKNKQNGRQEFSFINHEGDLVNGVLLPQLKQTSLQKFALALHPMGDSHSFWWREKSNLEAHKLSNHLRQSGYTVMALDARLHGERGIKEISPRKLLDNAHSKTPDLYNNTISGTVRDYRQLLNWIQQQHKPHKIITLGYSMGGQMSILLAHYETEINAILTMVPPFVESVKSPVAPRVHAPYISQNSKILWLAANNDQYSSKPDIQDSFNLVNPIDKEIHWFDSGHRLPSNYIHRGIIFIDSLESE